MNYNLIRSNRRSVALVVDRQGILVVRAPKFAALGEIERFVAQKRGWIEKHQRAAAEFNRRKKQYIEGEKFLFLGQEYPLRIVDGHQRRLVFNQREFLLSAPQAGAGKELFVRWYRRQAGDLFPKRAEFWQQKMGVNYKKLTVTGANTRWGSCSGRGTINFSWRLMAMPPEVIDYVVIHELAHLAHHNHSPKFWDLVGRFCPDFKLSKKWLNSRGKNPIL